MTEKTNSEKGVHFNRTAIIGVVLGVIILSSVISWGIVRIQAAPRQIQDTTTGQTTQMTAVITGINNTVQHLQDSQTGIGNFSDNLNNSSQSLQAGLDQLSSATQTQINAANTLMQSQFNSIQVQFGQVNNSLLQLTSGINGDISNINNDVSGLQDQITGKANQSDLTNLSNTVNTLTSTVNNNAHSISTLQTSINNITIPIPSGIINANNEADRFIWTADAAYTVTKIVFQQSAIENTSTNTTLMVSKVPNGTAISSGLPLLANSVNLKTNLSANTILAASLSSTASNLQLAAGDSLALDFTNTITEYVGCVTITLTRVQN
jgi:hypothetical protein